MVYQFICVADLVVQGHLYLRIWAVAMGERVYQPAQFVTKTTDELQLATCLKQCLAVIPRVSNINVD